jgi:heptosyltransferase-1
LIDATRRAYAVIGVDSGPLHLAAALSKPGVAIYGPTDPASHGPYGSSVQASSVQGGSIRVLRSPDAVTSYKRRTEIEESMRAITPLAVLESLGDAIREASSREPLKAPKVSAKAPA